MDRIHASQGPLRPQALAGPATDVGPAKNPSDYLRAIRRRMWMVLALAVPIGVGGSVFAVRQPAVYQATAHIKIEPPQNDPVLASLLPNPVGFRDQETLQRYVPNQVAMLRSIDLAEVVLREPGVVPPAGGNPAQELVNAIQTRPIAGSNHLIVTLEGPDPARVKKLLESLLTVFARQAKDANNETLERSKAWAEDSLREMKAELNTINGLINATLVGSNTIGPNGVSLIQGQYETIQARLAQKQMRHDEFEQQARITQLFPHIQRKRDPSPYDGRLAELERHRRLLTRKMQELQLTIRPGRYNADPSVKYTAAQLEEVMNEIDGLRMEIEASVEPEAVDPSGMILETSREEIRAYEEAARGLLQRIQESNADHQRFLNLLEDRQRKADSIAAMESRLDNFKWLKNSQNEPVTIPTTVAEPSSPVRPNRPLLIALSIVCGLALGLGSVCLLEHIDHSVKVPEHLTVGLTLPLFGVIPRIRRTSLVDRGGHLWTSGSPRSVEADAFRNLRASLLGLNGPTGPPVTLLITSAKAGEGKSTTALNLAATCARAGERTLLVDVDLRRPSLADVFPPAEDGHDLGLVDVLKDDLPWSRAVLRTDLPNLDFLPTGNTARIPIEILGSREMRQLLESLAESHYDRVILDGPAVLGLADCRMLGRMVDAALLVVRSGSLELRPLRRAKAMLEQSQVPLAGVVFNGLSEDLQNWSSYGPEPLDVAGSFSSRFAAGGLSGPKAEPAAALPGS